MKIKALLIATTLSSVSFVHTNTAIAGGIPVIDTASIAKYIEQIAAMKEQIENQVKQITELKNQVAAMTGGRGMGDLAREAIGNNIPDSWKDIYNNVANFNIDRLKGGYVEDGNVNGLLKMMDITEQSFSDIAQRIARIEELTNKINTTTDIKASADLQSRITAEQTAISNQQVKLDQMYRMYQMEKELQERKAFIKESCQGNAMIEGKSTRECK